MEPSWLPSSRGAASRPPAQQKVVSPGSDSVMRRLGLVIRGHDGLTRTRSHGALSLIRLPLPIVPPPPSPVPVHQPRTSIVTPGASTTNVPRWLEPQFLEEKPGVDQSHRRPRCVWQVPSWRAIACELSTGLGKVCSASQQPPANHERWRPLAWSGTRR